ncbi:MAG: isocitrate lyase/phosphoenolpyruvate mutase family protein, partial [Parvularculaceae bacterium]
FLYGDADLNGIIARLNAFEEAGVDVLFAPGLPDLDAVRAVCSSVSAPVNVLIHGKLAKCSREELAEAGAARISLGGALAFDAYAAMLETARAIKEGGSFDALKTRGSARKEISSFLPG